MTATEVLEEKGLTVKSLSIGVLFTVLVTFVFYNPAMGYRAIGWATQGPAGAIHSNIGYAGEFMFPYGMLWLILIPISVLNQRRAKPLLTKQELTVVTVMLFSIGSVAMWGGYAQFGWSWLNYLWGNYYLPEAKRADVYKWVSPLLLQRDTSIYHFLTESYAIGGTERIAIGAIPWGAWAPSIAWFTLIVAGMFFSGLFLVLLFRHLYIDVEAIPFPTTAALQTHLIDNASKVEGAGTWHFLSNKYFLAGIAFELFVGGMFMGVIYPSAAVWILGVNYPGRDYLMQTFGINWGLNFDFSYPAQTVLTASALAVAAPLTNMAWGYLLPLDILITFLVAWIIFNFIIPITVVGAGMAPKFPGVGFPGGHRQYFDFYALSYVIVGQWHNIFIFSLLAGVVLYQVWRHRESMGPILKSLVQKPPAHIEATSPMPYRWIWIGLLVSGLLWLAMGVIVGGPAIPWLIILAAMMIFFVGYSRLLAETGGLYAYPIVGVWMRDWSGSITIVLVNFLIWGFGYMAAKDYVAVHALSYPIVWYNMMPTFMLSWTALAAFKTGKNTGTRKGDILKAVAIVFALYAVLAPIAGFLWGALFPFRPETPNWSAAALPDRYVRTGGLVDTGAYYTFTPTPEALNGFLITFIAGIVTVALCYELRRKMRAFWWLNPIAIALAVWFGWFWFAGFTIALVLKYLVTKIGGAAAIEKVRLFALGILTAFFVSIFFKNQSQLWFITLGFAKGWGPWPPTW